ncbi:hypothetical protein BJ165DRAFT_1529583 [Panaeolus papilionaceus]|nr:hypothetical protein BJ165DRAFT_1529583 [Panaeolus papilionaceus]
MQDPKLSHLEKKRRYYLEHIEQERAKACERYKRRQEKQTTTDAEVRKERHRLAQARYREQNKKQLRIKSWEYRRRKALQASIDRDEEEFQRLWAMEDDD